ncbi:hypothetical protein [Bacteroides sp.]|uniref:GumC family protein n=1 Tax=Bacteroides sp. TaxID=29523 RepID=UPI0026031A27|nr:hypothetical protein [Bacteroides sp.]MDD3037753.1 hypothetical protein [Bacteroides sp.]
MNFIISTIRTLFRHYWQIILVTSICTGIAYYLTLNMRGGYDVKSTLYTGVASGYNLESEKQTNWAMVQNSMDNLISIIQAESTLKRVSIRLFARVLIEGNPDKEVNGITPASYNYTYNHVKNSTYGKEILALIDKSSEDKTVANFFKYMRPEKSNYLYGLFYYTHPYYSYEALKKIKVQRRLSSDLLDISYTSQDPGIAYNTMSILMKEFVNEYSRIRYDETDKVIAYFEKELSRTGTKLRSEEDDLTKYNVEKRIINYTDETKEIAAISKEYELREQDALFAYKSAKSMLEELEKHMDNNAKQVIKNLNFIDKLKEASTITGKISETEAISQKGDQDNSELKADKKRMNEIRQELSELADSYIGHKYTKEGVSRTNIIDQWLEQTLLFEKAKAELQIVQSSRKDLDERYIFFAPVGTTIKQKERSINFTEQNYLRILQSYNEALLRKKNLEMTSATLKVLNEPTYPISPNSTHRKQILIAVCVVSFLIVAVWLILIELLDRTLRDVTRAKNIAGFKVIGAVPDSSSVRYGGLNKTYTQSAIKEISNSLLSFFTERKSGNVYTVNLFSTSNDSNQEELGKLLYEYWQSRKLKTRLICHGVDFNIESSNFLLAKNFLDFYTPQGEDVLIIVYPSLEQCCIPTGLLLNTNLNLLVAPANRGWKTVDKQLSEQLSVQLGKSSVPLRMCLTYADRVTVEDFTGLLPPYTFIRKFIYQLSQLSLTEKIRIRKKAEVDNDDDE